MRATRIVAVGCASILALGAAACGSSKKSSTTATTGTTTTAATGGTVDIYSSLVLQGPTKSQTGPMVNGIKLALAQANNKAGQFTVKYTSLDDSTPQKANWDAAQTAQQARTAVQDPKAVYYIGEFNSGASAISIPILNVGGLAQVSPGNTNPGLTVKRPGTEAGAPEKYYPTGKRTYLRIVPRDDIQAADDLTVMKEDGCKKVAVANDKEVYGAGLAGLIVYEAPKVGVNLIDNSGIDKTNANFRSYAASIKAKGADCFMFAGTTPNGSVQISKDVAAAIPGIKIYGGDGICSSGFTSAKEGGIPASLAKQFKCTVATQDLKAYPGGRQFLADYKAKYGDSSPDPYAIYGYEAMKLGLDTIAGLGAKGNDRAAVVAALFATKNRKSVLGTYSFDKNGDTTQTAYALYKVGSDGNPQFVKAVEASLK